MRAGNVVVGILAVLLVALLLAALAGALAGGGMMGFGFVPWWGILMVVGMGLFWLLIVGGVVMLAVALFRQDRSVAAGPGPQARRPLEILNERYARGEITREEYLSIRHDLEEQ